MNTRTILGTSLFCFAFALAGCDTVKAPDSPRADTIASGSYPNVVAESGLGQFMGVDVPQVIVDQPTDTRPLRVQVPVRSLSDSPFAVQYQWTWLDRDGRFIRTSGWMDAMMEPRQQVLMTGNALDGKAERWRLEIRSAR